MTVSVNIIIYCILGLAVLICLCEILNSFEAQLRGRLMIRYGTLLMSSGFIWTKCCKILISLYNGVNIFKVRHPECNNLQVTGRIFESTVPRF